MRSFLDIPSFVEFLKKSSIQIRFSLVIGNFDGVHLGHRHLFSTILGGSSEDSVESCKKNIVCMTFIPHPILFFKKNTEGFLLRSYEQRGLFLEILGVKYLLELNFDEELSQMNGKDFFLEKIFPLKEWIDDIYVGSDFHFGHKRLSNGLNLKEWCEKNEIGCTLVQKHIYDGVEVSSSYIRKCLQSGDLEKVNFLLGAPFSIRGEVVHELGRGTQMGHPTANMKLSEERLVPPHGVYISQTFWKERSYPSITNIGCRPTFSGPYRVTVETHILNFNQMIYGEIIQIDLLKMIRPEMKFQSVDQLIVQIKEDLKHVLPYFKEK
jgi:riboflavin kinase/FMN adenylyltransferase